MKKMLYCCETCGKKYNKEEDAFGCEQVHAEEKVRKEKLLKARESREKEVNNLFKTFYDAYKSFYRDYGIFPKLDGEFNKINPFEGLFQFIF